ncbi:MAG: hypothetical protein JWO06_3002 [Bacteroidota bacterium]|jgi:hypothetical protein|nr:hypothetical protein [Bacteroidota bacterium]
MGYIREPKNIDLVVGPSVLTEDTKSKIEQAITQYKKTGQKSVAGVYVKQDSTKMSNHAGHKKPASTATNRLVHRKEKI